MSVENMFLKILKGQNKPENDISFFILLKNFIIKFYSLVLNGNFLHFIIL